MNSKDIKIAMSIKRKKKAGTTKTGSMNHTVAKAVKIHKDIHIHEHNQKGGIHKQNAKGVKNVNAK